MDYRREIDGLRSVAVLPVVFFHAGFQLFSGGYVGVDVFFVISGYLITSIIAAELLAGNFSFHRDYVTPSYITAKPGEAEALDLMMKIAASGSTSRLYKKLVVETGVASSAGGEYSGGGMDSGTLSVYAVAADGVPLEKVEAAVDGVFAGIAKNGVTAAELERAKNGYIADYVYESDNQATLARRYGWNLAVGRTVADIENWPAAISKVTLDDVKKAAVEYLDVRRSVTGYLIPDKTGVAQRAAPAAPGPASDSVLR